MRSELTWRRKKAERYLQDEIGGDDRYVDFGVLFRIVRADPDGDELLPDKPRLRVIEEHVRGGIVDTKASPPVFVGPTRSPVVFHLSEKQWELVQHDDAKPLRALVYGSMGAGKTTLLVAWITLRVIEFTGVRNAVGGVTAPTNPRMMQIKEMIGGQSWQGGGFWPRAWFHWKQVDQRLYCANGVAVDFRSTHRTSKAEGSPIQGNNWMFHAGDELQDSLEADSDIEARGRAAPGGRYKRINTVTAKDHPDWRDFRARCAASPMWAIHMMLGTSSPFVHPDYWSQLRMTMTQRDFDRKVLCQDVASEDRIYTSWAREHNLRHYPMIGARDVTESVCRVFGTSAQYGYLIGNDVGERTDVTIFLKAFVSPGRKVHDWWVMGELTSKNATTEEHALRVMAWLNERNCNMVDANGKFSGPRAIALTDPQTDRNVIAMWRKLGLEIRPAAYKPGTRDPMRIPKEARIDVVNTLLCDASGNRRLFVHADDKAQPSASRLVQAFEMAERDASGRAEHERKDDRDLSHWPSALGYALFALERPRINQLKVLERHAGFHS